MWWFQSPKIAFGEDALEVLKDLEGKKAFIVTDKAIRNLGYVDIVSNYLKEAGMDVKVFDEVESEPSIENVMEGTSRQSHNQGRIPQFEPRPLEWAYSKGCTRRSCVQHEMGTRLSGKTDPTSGCHEHNWWRSTLPHLVSNIR